MNKFLFLILISTFSFSQSKSGVVVYDLYITLDEATLEMDKKFKLLQKAVDVSKEIEYVLKFNDNEANFTQVAPERLDFVALNAVNVLSGVSKNNYLNIEKKFILKEILATGYLFKKEEFVVKDTLNTSWEITKESKMIGDYLCFKATTKKKTIKIVDDKQKEFFENVTAWFAPSLPFSFGLANYAGLPGLILELQDKLVGFVVKKIKLNEKLTIEILKADKIITSDEYNQLSKERMDLLMEMSEQK
jgi:GLPGLI family protein